MKLLEPLNIDDKERKRLYNIINNTKNHDISIIRPCKVIYCYDKYMNINDIIEETNVSRKSIFTYLKKYRKDKYFMFKNRKNSSRLDEYKDIIRNNFKNNPVHSYREATKRIKEITGIEISSTQVYYFLNNPGNNYKKNKNGNYTKNGEANTKIENTYLYQHLEEIGNYIDNNPSGEKRVIINRIRNKFPEIKEKDDVILEALKNYLPF